MLHVTFFAFKVYAILAYGIIYSYMLYVWSWILLSLLHWSLWSLSTNLLTAYSTCVSIAGVWLAGVSLLGYLGRSRWIYLRFDNYLLYHLVGSRSSNIVWILIAVYEIICSSACSRVTLDHWSLYFRISIEIGGVSASIISYANTRVTNRYIVV